MKNIVPKFEEFLNENKEVDYKKQFKNLGRDEEGRLIGNCKKCGKNGVDVEAHVKKCKI